MQSLRIIEVHNVGPSPTAVFLLADFLKAKCEHFVHIQHFLNRDFHSSMTEYGGGKVVRLRRFPGLRLPQLLLYFLGTPKTLLFTLALTKKFDYWIGGDELSAFVGVLMRKLGIVRKVIFYSIDYFPQRFSRRPLNALYDLLERVVVHNCDCIWDISELVRDARIRQGSDRERNLVVPHGIHFSADDLPSNLPSRKQLVFVGSLSFEKGLQLAIEAMPIIAKRCPNVSLVVIGRGSYESQLKKLVRSLSLDASVSFKGFLPRQEVNDILRQSAIGVATYIPPEKNNYTYYAFPSKIIEYLAFGLPVIMTSLPSLTSLIHNGKVGFIVDYDPQAFAKAALKLLTDDVLFKECRDNATSLASRYQIETIFADATIKTIRLLEKGGI